MAPASRHNCHGGRIRPREWTPDKLITASVTSGSASAVKNEASFITAQQPSLFQPNPDDIAVWKNTVSGPPAAFESLTQCQLNPEQMYLTN